MTEYDYTSGGPQTDPSLEPFGVTCADEDCGRQGSSDSMTECDGCEEWYCSDGYVCWEQHQLDAHGFFYRMIATSNTGNLEQNIRALNLADALRRAAEILEGAEEYYSITMTEKD